MRRRRGRQRRGGRAGRRGGAPRGLAEGGAAAAEEPHAQAVAARAGALLGERKQRKRWQAVLRLYEAEQK